MDSLLKWDKQTKKLIFSNRLLAYILGFGLVLYAVHNRLQPGVEQGLFIPHIGIAIIIFCLMLVVTKKHWRPNLGPKWVWIPMLVIVASGFLRLIVDFSLETFTGGLFLLVMFSVYLMARELGKDILYAFIPFLIIECVSVIVMGFMYQGVHVGGIITSPPMADVGANYDIAIGFITFGFVVSRVKWQWLLVPLCLVAMIMTGSPEGLFIIALMGAYLLWRRDWNRRLWITLAALVLIGSLWVGLGPGKELYAYTTDKIEQASIGEINEALTGRLHVIEAAMSDIQPLGHGYEPGVAESDTVHNVPLVIVDQLGIVAAIAYMVAVVYLFIKTRWKYAWLAIIGLGIWDHFVWTQLAPYWFVLAGVSTSAKMGKDFIYKGSK